MPRPSTSTQPTRFVIRDIDVENFKSYAGAHRIGPFHKTFTCVIGPNGSGKSNVIDAMLFVFGKSAKKIRLEKLSELIHSSAAFPDLSYASVTVNFIEVRETPEDAVDHAQRLEIPGTELSIKREVHRNNQSQYFINNTRSTQKEVVATLTGHGVDLDHNRFLILQGEVEQISLMKPKAEKEGEEGLLEYLDDLIGTNQYLDKISDATGAFDRVQEERLNLLDDLRRAEADRNALEAAKTSTVDYVTKDNHLQSILIVLCQIKTAELEQELVEPRRLLDELKGQLAEVDRQVTEKTKDIGLLNKKEDAQKKAIATVHKDRDAARSRKLACEEDFEKEKAHAEEIEKQRKKEADKIKKAKEELAQLQVQVQAAELDVGVKEQRLVEAREELARLEPEHDAARDALSAKQQPIRMELERSKRALQPFAKKLQEAKEARETAVERVRREEEKRLRLEEDYDKARQEKFKQTQIARDIQEMIDKAEQDTTAQQLLQVREALKARVASKLQIAQSIEEAKRQFKEGTADDRIADFLLSQRDIKGYYGTLRQLGRIDEAYDIAAGTASGHWGHLIVEDQDAAKQVLQRLKDHNKGRATVVILKEVSRRLSDRMDKKFHPPENAIRLFDMIQPINERFRVAFYNAVQDTLVCDGLVMARRIAFGSNTRHRVVTKSGELVEPNGTISAGGQPRYAKLKAARAPQDQQVIRETLTRLQEELRQAVESENAVREQLVHLDAHQSTTSPENLRRMKMQLKSAQSAVTVAEQRMLESETQLAQYNNTPAQQELRNTLQRRADEATQLMTQCEAQQQQYRNAVDDLEQQLEDVGGAAFRGLVEALKATRQRVDNDEAALREGKKVLQKAKGTKERKEKDMTEAQTRLEALQQDNAEQHKEELMRLRGLVEAATKELLRHQTVVAEAESVLEAIKAQIQQVEEQVRDLGKQRDEVQRNKDLQEATISRELGQLEKLAEKSQRCEEHIRENIRTYGSETFDMQGRLLRNHDEYPNEDDDVDGDRRRASTKHRKREREEEEDAPRLSSQAGDDMGRPSQLSATAPEPAVQQLSEQQIMSLVLTVAPEDLHKYDYQHSSHLARNITEELRRLEQTIDFSAVARWREKDIVYRRVKDSYDTVRSRLDEAESHLLELKDKRKTEFMACFLVIQRNVKEMYQMLTHGGDAEVELVDTQDPFEGINFLVRPPKKSWKQVINLSGGEKTLSSLALVFALHHVRPTPIYVMDEIDAALDFRNVSIVANYVLRQATGAQFVIISLRNNMFELAHQLVGVCKVRDVTRSLTLNPHAIQGVIRDMVVQQQIERKRRRESQAT